ncbi:hypothetical protein Tco_0889102 [Tanacetum coccineum]
MKSIRAIQSQFKFLIDTLQDFGTMPIFKRTFSQDLDLLEQHLTKEIISQTDCKTILTKLKTTFVNAFNSEFKERIQKYTRFDDQSFKDSMIRHMDFIDKYMLETILRQQEIHQDNDTFTSTMLLNVDELQKQLDKEEFQEDRSMAAFWVINRQFQQFINSQFTLDYDSQMTNKYFVEYTGIKVKQFRDTLLQLIESSGTELEVQDDNSRSGNDTDVDDANIRPIYDEEPMDKVQFTA